MLVVLGNVSGIPDSLIVVRIFHRSMLVCISFKSEELAATAENRVIADVVQVVSQVIDAVQSFVAIAAGKGRNHLAGKWVAELHDA